MSSSSIPANLEMNYKSRYVDDTSSQSSYRQLNYVSIVDQPHERLGTKWNQPERDVLHDIDAVTSIPTLNYLSERCCYAVLCQLEKHRSQMIVEEEEEENEDDEYEDENEDDDMDEDINED